MSVGATHSSARARSAARVPHISEALARLEGHELDPISSGRLELGIGAGASAYDWTMTSGAAPWPQTERVARFTEAVEIVDGLLRGTLGSYAGR